MEYKKIGNMKIPVLGLGTWGIGGRLYANKLFKQKWIKIIQEALDIGFRHIDTSEIYGNGFTEEIIGEAISSYRRKDIFLTSKIWGSHLNHDDTVKSLKSSLKRLKTEYLDLYLIHKPSRYMDLKNTMHDLEYLQKQKLIKALGVSNFNQEQILEAQKFLNKSKISAVQNEYSLLKRDKEVLDLCNQQKIIFIAYRPLMKGELARPGILVLDKLAKKYNKTQAQIALSWLISNPQIVTIPKATKKEHLLANIDSVGWKMDKDDYRALDDMTHETI